MMKVKLLIEKLQALNPEADVHFAHPVGDADGNIICPPVTDVEEVYLRVDEIHALAAFRHTGNELVVVLLS
jgi:hypothetical protein